MTAPRAVVGRAVATAPVRVADVGGWTDTWFGSPGRVCHLAVGPGVVVDATLVDGADGDLPVRLVAPTLSEDYRTGPDPERGWGRPAPGRQPLLEHAIASVLESVELGDGCSIELTITSAVPAGASLGTSGAVVVALFGALDALVGAARSPSELARAAHAVETDRAGRQSGVQDQWAAALGGCALLAVGPYPDVRHRAVPLDPATLAEVGDRLVTVVFGPHDSSAVHREVIDAVLGCGGPAHDRARAGLDRLASLAGDAADALRAGDVDGWAAVLTAATEGQRALHPALVGPAHDAAIDVARRFDALGWKVNGAGGDGGSLSVVAADAPSARRLAGALARVDPSWRVAELRPAPGLAVVTDGP